MQQDFISMLYENFLIVTIILTMLILLFFGLLVWFLMRRIGTRVLVLKKNSAHEHKAKESKTDLITFGKRSIKRKTDPYIIKRGSKIFRLFFVREDDEETIDLPRRQDKDSKSFAHWRTIIEDEVIKQGLSVLSRTGINWMSLLMGLGLGGFATMLILTLGGVLT